MSLSNRQRKLARYGTALVIFCAALAAWFHGIVLHPGSRIPCCLGDGTASIRDLWLASHLHKNPLTLRFDPLNGAPEGKVRTPATVLANSGLQSAFVWGAGRVLGFVAAWNLYLLAGFIGTSMATFALLDWLGCGFVASLFGAYVFGFSPNAFERAYAGHPAFIQNWVFVLTVLAMVGVRERRTLGRAAMVGGAVAVAFYVSSYQGLFAGVIALAFYAVDLVRTPPRRERIRTVALASVSLWVTAACLIPMFALYRAERSTVLATTFRPTRDLFAFAARLPGYFLPSPRNPLFHWIRGVHPSNLTEETMFFGYTTLALALAAYVLLSRRDRWLQASDRRRGVAISFAVLAPLAFLLSLPPAYHVGWAWIPTPSILVAAMSTFWRAYARFGALFGFAVAVLGSLALTSLSRRHGFRHLAPVALGLVLLELLPGNVHAFDTRASAAPAWVSWLATQPVGIVASYPMTLGLTGPADRLAQTQLFWQTVDRDPSFMNVGQSSAEFGSRNESIRLLAFNLTDQLSARVLATNSVRYVLVSPAAYRASGQPVPTPDPAHFRLLKRAQGMRIYSVRAERIDLPDALRANRRKVRKLRSVNIAGPISEAASPARD